MERTDTVEQVNGIRIRYVRQGTGPLVVLLHGWPQHSHAWRRVMPLMAERCTVVAPDLRGYGLTDKPTDGYDKRTMAADVRALARQLGFDRVALIVGHDRGARVAHRYGLEYPDEVDRVAMLDIIPTREVLRQADIAHAKRYWHWLFHVQPDLPELFIGPNIEAYIRFFFRYAYIRPAVEEAVGDYVRELSRPGALRASIRDYEATFERDLADDEASAADGRLLTMPALVLWGAEGPNSEVPMLDVWRQYATDVTAASVPRCGYYMPEEQPEALVERLLRFMACPRRQR